MANWWLGLSARERLLVAAGGITLVITLLVIKLWVPLQNSLQSERDALKDQRELLVWMKPRADELESRRKSGQPVQTNVSPGELLVVADRSAKAAGIGDSVQRTNHESDGGVRMVLENARFDDVISWLAQLYRGQGVDVSSLAITAKDQPGYVDVRVSLRAGGE